MRTWAIFIILLLSRLAVAENPENAVRCGFLKTSIQLGEPVQIWLCVSHPATETIVFPDSNWTFEPFEFISKTYYPTRTQNGISRDCTIYHVRTFEIAPQASLAPPIFVIAEDTFSLYPKAATIVLQQLVTRVPKTPELKEETQFYTIQSKINFPMTLLVIIVIVFVGVIVFLLFGKPIIRRYNIMVIIFSHRTFLKTFEQHEKTYNTHKDADHLEALLGHWKSYLSKLEQKPISSYTSTEIISMYGKEDLKNSLQIIDRAIFGGILSSEEDKAVKTLKNFSNKRYILRKNEIRAN